MELGWVDEHLPAARTGPLEVFRDRPWSLVAKVTTATGAFYVKENRGQTRYEAVLSPALAQWVPGRVLTPLAADHDRGWLLLPDGGPILRDSPADLIVWEQLVTAHAQLQRDLAEFATKMVALGVPDHRPAAFEANLARLPLTETIVEHRPALLALNAKLAQSPIPASLQHDDLHDGNVFADGRTFDWGDANVGHPFGVLLVTLRMAASRFEVPDGDPLVQRLRDAYLEPWSDLADRATLLTEARAAVQVAKVGRSLSWQRALAQADAAAIAEWGDRITDWLDDVREPIPW